MLLHRCEVGKLDVKVPAQRKLDEGGVAALKIRSFAKANTVLSNQVRAYPTMCPFLPYSPTYKMSIPILFLIICNFSVGACFQYCVADFDSFVTLKIKPLDLEYRYQVLCMDSMFCLHLVKILSPDSIFVVGQLFWGQTSEGKSLAAYIVVTRFYDLC